MKYSIRYDIKSKTKDNSDGRALIRLRVSWAGQRVETLTGLQVNPEYWDVEEQRVRSSYRHSGDTGASLNSELSKLTTFIENVFTRHNVDEEVPTASTLKRRIRIHLGKEAPKSEMSLFECYDLFTSSVSIQNQWSDTTRRRVNNLKNHLYAFAPKLEFSDLDEQCLQKFLMFLIGNGLRNTTVEKNMSILRWFIRWASEHGHTDNTTALNYKPKLKGTDGNSKEIIYLDWDELMELYNHDFKGNVCHEQVRDVFCFCCFTGLRYSDVAKLDTSDVHDNYISVVTQKTTDGLRIELNDYSRAIMEKYKGNGDKKHKRLLPVISNQKMNDYLKDVGKEVGIDVPIRIVYYKGSTRHEEVHPKWELMSTHCGRRTFVVNALSLGIPAEVIMKWTGHSDYQAMKPYIAVVDKLKEQEMAKFNRIPNNSPKNPRKSSVE